MAGEDEMSYLVLENPSMVAIVVVRTEFGMGCCLGDHRLGGHPLEGCRLDDHQLGGASSGGLPSW